MNRTIAVTENLYYNLFLSEARNSDGLFVGPHIEKPGFVQFSWVRHFTSRSTLPTQKYGWSQMFTHKGFAGNAARESERIVCDC